MKEVWGIKIGGLEQKIVNLVLVTILLMTAAFSGISLYQSNTLNQLASESSQRQQEAIGEITGEVMDAVVKQSLARSNRTGAAIADAMFGATAQQVTFIADAAAKLFADPAAVAPAAYSDPDPKDDGHWTAKVLYAEETDPADPAVAVKLGLAANLSETMISLCPAMDVTAMYIGLPEGAFLYVGQTSSAWVENGIPRAYDPRTRGWYQKAAETGTLVFTDGEWDAATGEYCVECAMPVYGPKGNLQAVIGIDMFLTDMEEVITSLSVDGEQCLLVNQNGHAVLEPQAEAFPMETEERECDLRLSRCVPLAQAVSNALNGEESEVGLGTLQDSGYYYTAAPIPSTGWVLVSAFSESISAQPITILQNSNAQIQEETVSAYGARMNSQRTYAIILLILVMLLAFTAALILGKRVVKPLNTITRRIAEISEDRPDFQMEEVYCTGDEVEILARSFESLSARTRHYIEQVTKVTAEKERIGTELALANRIQADMMPNIYPAFPDRKEFDIYATMDPAKEVGGDFYDFFLVDDDHLCMVMADVSGKGVPAALFMMASKILLNNQALTGKSPEEILTATNNMICSNNREEMFVTVWLGILEISTGKLTAANAGHEYPVLQHKGERFEILRDKHGFVVGGMAGMKYKEYELQLQPGDKLFLYTDGVPEATNAENVLFGTEAMLDALNRDTSAHPVEVLKQVRSAVDSFVQDAEQFDDMTMLCMEYTGGEGGGEIR